MTILFNSNKSKVAYIVTAAIAVFLIYTLALEFGIDKLLHPSKSFEGFASMGLPAFTVYLVAFAEAVCPVLMFVRPIAAYAAMVIVINFAVVIYLQATVLSGDYTWSIVFILLSLIVAFLMRPDFMRRRRVIQTIRI